jgi:hypothetical protein
LWANLPFVSSIELVRFALPVSLCVALLLAASIDGWWSVVAAQWPSPRDVRRRTCAQFAVVALVVAAFIPLFATYSVPFRVTTGTVPEWFAYDASHLPSDTAVLTIPFAYGIASQPMAWQAETNDDFDLIGGWAFVPGGDGVKDEMVSALGGPVAALRAFTADPLATTTAAKVTIRAALMSWRPLVVVVIPRDATPQAAGAMAAILGLSPVRSDGMWVWDLHRTTTLGPIGNVVGSKGPRLAVTSVPTGTGVKLRERSWTSPRPT